MTALAPISWIFILVAFGLWLWVVGALLRSALHPRRLGSDPLANSQRDESRQLLVIGGAAAVTALVILALTGLAPAQETFHGAHSEQHAHPAPPS